MQLVHKLLREFSEDKKRETQVEIDSLSGSAIIARCKATAYIAVVFLDNLSFSDLQDDEKVTIYIIEADVDVISSVSAEEYVARIYLSNHGVQIDPSDSLKIAEIELLSVTVSKLLQNLEASL